MLFTNRELETMWWCAYNYALGRMTYIANDVRELIMGHYDEIPSRIKWLMLRDIENALIKDVAGMQYDAGGWVDVLRRLKQHENEYKSS